MADAIEISARLTGLQLQNSTTPSISSSNLDEQDPKNIRWFCSRECELISALSKDGRLQDEVSPKLGAMIEQHFETKYDILDITIQVPYIIFHCGSISQIPRLEERPLLVAGLVAIWHFGRELFLYETIDPGYAGRRNLCKHLWKHVGLDVVQNLKRYMIPKPQTLQIIQPTIDEHIEAISFINNYLLIEYPTMSKRAFDYKRAHTAGTIGQSDVTIKLHNGPVHTLERDITEKLDNCRAVLQQEDTDNDRGRGFMRKFLYRDLFYIEASFFQDVEERSSDGTVTKKAQPLQLICTGLRLRGQRIQGIFSMEYKSEHRCRREFAPVRHLATGKIAGVMHLPSNIQYGNVLCYADAFISMDAPIKNHTVNHLVLQIPSRALDSTNSLAGTLGQETF